MPGSTWRPSAPTTHRLWTYRRPAGFLALAIAAVLLAVQPDVALAIPRPNWNPGAPWAPLTPASHEMRQISDLFWVMLVLSAIIFIGVAGMIVISIVRFTARPDQSEPSQVFGNRTVEVAWTAVPFFILILAFGFTVRAIHDINTPEKGVSILNVNAIGHQWWWQFQYPSLGVDSANEVHVPTGVNIHFHVESADVVHSFWVPRLERQIDANPGQDNAVFVKLNQTGTFDGACYEYCGTAHAWMKFRMIVQTPAQFAAWARHEHAPAAKPATSQEALGQRVFLHNTCIDCHLISGTSASGSAAPDLTHVGSRWSIGAGAVPLDRTNLMAWIRDPSTYKPGANMPPYPLLSKKDLQALAAYLLSLK